MSTQIPQKKVKETSLNLVLLFTLEPHIWSGKKKLLHEDLKVDATELPPSELASLGAKKIIDTDLLKPFDALKKRAHRICDNVGVRFLGGYAVPISKAQSVAAELDQVEDEWEVEKANFISKYQASVEKWIAENGTWGEIIRSSITPVGYVEDAISFKWQAIRVAEPGGAGKAKQVLGRGLGVQVGGLAQQLFREIADAANDVIEKSLHGRDKVSQKILNRVRQLRNKMHDLAFLDPCAEPVVKMMDYTLSLLPTKGHLEGIHYMSLRGLVSMIADPASAREHGESILNGQSVEATVSKVVLKKKANAGASGADPASPTDSVPKGQNLLLDDVFA